MFVKTKLSEIDWLEVSPEMITMIGPGKVKSTSWPVQPIAFHISYGRNSPPSLKFFAKPSSDNLAVKDDQMRLLLIVSNSACERIFRQHNPMKDGVEYYLPAELRAISQAISDCTLPESAKITYRAGKSIELLCEIFTFLKNEILVPLGQDISLSHADGRRIVAARTLIDERWSEKLTIDMIACACGLNRAKLTRGFRDMFDCTIAEAISTQRLGEAGRMLTGTDLPVSSIGYKCGYQNNASFSRAFTRRFGIAPTEFRACGDSL